MKKTSVIALVLLVLLGVSVGSAKAMEYWGKDFVSTISYQRNVNEVIKGSVDFAERNYRYNVDISEIVDTEKTSTEGISQRDIVILKSYWKPSEQPKEDYLNTIIESKGKLLFSSDKDAVGIDEVLMDEKYYYILLDYSNGTCNHSETNIPHSEISYCSSPLDNVIQAITYDNREEVEGTYDFFMNNLKFIGHQEDRIMVYFERVDIPLIVNQYGSVNDGDITYALVPVGAMGTLIIGLFFLIIKEGSLRDIGLFKFARMIKFELAAFGLYYVTIGSVFIIFIVYNIFSNSRNYQVVTELYTFMMSSFGYNLVSISIWFLFYSSVMFIVYLIKSYIREGFMGFIKDRTLFGTICIHSISKILRLNKYIIGLIGFLLADLFVVFLLIQSGFFGRTLALLNVLGLIVAGVKLVIDYTSDVRNINKLVTDLNEGRFRDVKRADIHVCYFRDIQDKLLNVREGFEKAVQDELRSRDMKTELITNVSHDLKTPITGMQNYLELLQDENLDVQTRNEYIDRLYQYTSRLGILVNDLFDLSKAKSGEVSLEYMNVNFMEMLEQIIVENDKELEAVDLEIVLNAELENTHIVLDSEKTYRAISNIISNLAKYALPHTRVYIDVKENSEYLVFTSKNISKEALVDVDKNLTARFVRGDRSRTTAGHGLGLSIAKSFVEAQDGMLKLEVDADLFTVIVALSKNHKLDYEAELIEEEEVA